MRRLFTTLAILSLLAGVAACALWAQSYWLADAYAWGGDGGVFGLRSNRGTLSYLRVSSIDPMRYPLARDAIPTGLQSAAPDRYPPPFPPTRQFAGFHRVAGTAFALRIDEWALPHWFPALAAAVLPAARVARQTVQRRRDRAGRCRRCGYDLRATPNRCPECGAVPATGGARP